MQTMYVVLHFLVAILKHKKRTGEIDFNNVFK